MREHALPAADSTIVEAGGRVFLQSTRFDRTPVLGRSGLVSLAALDAAYYGHGRIHWWRYAPELQRDGWIGADDARRLRLVSWFGALIANDDMHLGNAALHLQDARPLPLAPAYDMSSTHFRPAANGEVVVRRFDMALPTPEHRDDWREAAGIAQAFWRRAADDARLSSPFRAIAGDAAREVARALARI